MVRTAPRKAAKQERSRATVEAILTAAARLLVRDGFDRTTTTRIAELAGASIGSLYQYFPTKEAIVGELLDRHMARTMAVVEGELAGLATVPLAAAVRRVVEAFVHAYSVDRRLRRVFVEQVPRVGRLDRVRDLEKRLAVLVGAYLAAHAKELRRPLDLEAATFVVIRAVAAVTYAAILEPTDIPTETLIDETTRLVLSYLGA